MRAARTVAIGDVCAPKIDKISSSFTGMIEYVDISAVDNVAKRITSTQRLESKSAPSRAKQIIYPGDILISTVRPNLNAVAVVDIEREDTLVASTGYCVLRCNDEVDVRYLFQYCRSQTFIEHLSSLATGASYPAVTGKIVHQARVPLPPLKEQRRIASELDLICHAIYIKKEQIANLNLLVKSRFFEMFGDVIENNRGWPLTTLEKVADIRIGPFGTLLHKEDCLSGGHALVNPSHIVDGMICISEDLTVSDEKYEELNTYKLQLGDIVLGRRGEMGRCAVVYEDGLLCGTGSMIIRPNDQMKPYFLQNIISSPSYKKILESKAVGMTMMNLNVPIVASLPIPLLPIGLQNEFVAFMNQADNSNRVLTSAIDYLRLLYDERMNQYFGDFDT